MKIKAKPIKRLMFKDLAMDDVFRFPDEDTGFFMKVVAGQYVDLGYGNVLTGISPVADVIRLNAELVIYGDE